ESEVHLDLLPLEKPVFYTKRTIFELSSSKQKDSAYQLVSLRQRAPDAVCFTPGRRTNRITQPRSRSTIQHKHNADFLQDVVCRVLHPRSDERSGHHRGTANQVQDGVRCLLLPEAPDARKRDALDRRGSETGSFPEHLLHDVARHGADDFENPAQQPATDEAGGTAGHRAHGRADCGVNGRAE
ncbi:unnamed protein product, partial [Amoebophrya sp. A120]